MDCGPNHVFEHNPSSDISKDPPTRRVLFEETYQNQENFSVDDNKSWIPKLGIEFQSEEDAYDFYNIYSGKVGFSVRRHWKNYFPNGILRSRMFCCSAQGFRGKDKRDENVRRHRPETRFGCPAHMQIVFNNGKYRVEKFEATHNHVVVSPSKVFMLKSHRQIAPVQAHAIDTADQSGISAKSGMEFISREVGGPESVGFALVDYKNYLRTKRQKAMEKGDAGGVLHYFQKLQLYDPSSFYAIQLDVDDLITNIFWATSQMIMDYRCFGDVVCFDTTYKTNKDGRPFAMFVGVNHHKQSIIFGAALLYDETIPTFEWLFKTFLKSMEGKEPKTILTDQDQAMANAIASKMPNTYHRLCLWHIYQNAAKHLSFVLRDKSFVKDFKSCIYDFEEEDDFVVAWNNMLEKYNLIENKWLKEKFEERQKWALVYGRHTFCADMSTTQRSESMNRLIKRYLNSQKNLLRFFEHFERILEDRHLEELRADFKMSQSQPNLPAPLHMLKHASVVYTPSIFALFQRELLLTLNCNIWYLTHHETTTQCKISVVGEQHEHFVSYDSSNSDVVCSCKKFEFVGILCAHALKVLDTMNIRSIPSQYVLKRWTKDAKKWVSNVGHHSTSSQNHKQEMRKRYRDMCKELVGIATKAADYEKAYSIVKQYSNIMLKEVEECLKKMTLEEFPTSDALLNKSVDENLVVDEEFTSLSENVSLDQSTYLSSLNEVPCKAKGIKVKKKRERGSRRIRGALEKSSKKKRVQHPNVTSDNAPQDIIRSSSLFSSQVRQESSRYSDGLQ